MSLIPKASAFDELELRLILQIGPFTANIFLDDLVG